jgi:two-component system response regulator GlrR
MNFHPHMGEAGMAEERLLVVDDDSSVLEVLRLRLQSSGYRVDLAQKPDQALQLVKERSFDLALIDLKLNDHKTSGLELMQKVHQLEPDIPVIILTAYGTIENAVQAMKLGAYSYLTKPYDHRDLMLQIRKGLEKAGLSREVKRLQGLVDEKYGLDNIIGTSSAMQEVLRNTAQAAETDSNVAIFGESGTGKELIAKSLHLLSRRKDRPFVAINCSSIAESLLESELFGYEKGAFTGAVKKKKGLFEMADSGTLFLDEISETPMSMQAKLLRVLEDWCFYPVGGEKPQRVDVRVISASNQDLAQKVAEGCFRKDLFYRLHVIPIIIPPLRERSADIPLLANHFLDKYARKMNKRVQPFPPSLMQRLTTYDWPGNVRELENVIEYAVAMSSGKIREKDVMAHIRKDDGNGFKPLKQAKKEFERDYLVKTMRATRGNVTRASLLLGKHRADLYELLKKHGLRIEEFKSSQPRNASSSM